MDFKKSAFFTKLVLLNSVLATFKTCKFLSLESATTTQCLLLPMKVELVTLSRRRLWRDHSPRQPSRSVTVARVRPSASNSIILWPFSVRRPFTDSLEASFSRTCLENNKFILLITLRNPWALQAMFRIRIQHLD
jgi:hypothetical protein